LRRGEGLFQKAPENGYFWNIMLETVTIKNFRSLRDVTLNLQKVNLLIGPNNSGKTNFLKSLAFLKEHFNGRIQPSIIDLRRYFFKNKIDYEDWPLFEPITFSFKWHNKDEDFPDYDYELYQLELYSYFRNNLVYSEGRGTSQKKISKKFSLSHFGENILDFSRVSILFSNNGIPYVEPNTKVTGKIKNSDNDLVVRYNGTDRIFEHEEFNYTQGQFLSKYLLTDDIVELFNTIKIYRPDPAKITKENDLFTGVHLDEDCSNLVSFLDNMRDGHDAVWQAIQKDLQKCIPDFQGISFEKVQINGKESLGKRFGLRDREGKVYWAEELSEGTIYFLALLAIVHQPDPPKVLLLEEPEKGIHPRRIAEVMDLIFRLAEDKDIQIIMTSHSTQVVDAFQEIPESVFVFDMIDGETKVKNLLTDILEPDAKDAEAKNFPPIDYSKRSLSEHWATGLLGGVPH
jgi:energy-coupling factor transporter ATP-binding protein EcfA2